MTVADSTPQARYLRDRDLQREINARLNGVEAWNGVNDIPFFGRSGALASNRRDQRELSVLSLDLLQAAPVYVNTLMIQDILVEPEWADALIAEDRRGLRPCSPPTYSNPVRRGEGEHDQQAQPVQPAPGTRRDRSLRPTAFLAPA